MAPASALALQSGVHIDPNSPAGIEYAFPLGSVRTELSGQPPNSSPATSSGPPFGIGIHIGATGATRRAVRGHRDTRFTPARPATVAQARRLESMVSGGSFGGPVVALVAGVLLAGLLAGWLGSVLRRHALGS